jgi:hypothetical protein
MRIWSRVLCAIAASVIAVGPALAGGGVFDDDEDDSAGQPFFGFVRDRSGSPLSGAKVTVSVPKQNTSLVVRTDQQGQFFIKGFDKSIAADDVEFACSKDGYVAFAQARSPTPSANGALEITCILAKQ